MRDLETACRADQFGGEASLDQLTRIHASFEEWFQCLLGMGMQNLPPWAIARSIYQGATHMKIQLPHNVLRMLEVVADTAWQPSDLLELNSLPSI